MPFALSKALQLALDPLVGATALLLVAFLWSWRRPGRARGLVLAAWVLLYGLGSGAVAERLVAPLERAFPVPPDAVRTDAVVVLAGTVDLARSTPRRVELYHRAERIFEGARLVTQGRARWLVISGGSGDPDRPGAREAELLAVLARQLGVPADRIVLETRSRTTHENAAYTVPLLRERGFRSFFLVTTAMDMPRAVACFRKEGAEPIPFPVDYRVTPPGSGWKRWVPDATTLVLSAEAIHEYVGYAVYWALGYL